jgi:AraC-like DNA-binding protein
VTTFKAAQAKSDPTELDVAYRRIREFSFHAAAFDYYLPLKRLDTYVKEHLDQPLTSTEAAAIANYERSYFSDFFREKTRVAFKDWNSYRRIQQAFQMLSSCDDSLTVIAEKCGFPSIRVFETHCLRWTGIQPKTLQRLIRQQI